LHLKILLGHIISAWFRHSRKSVRPLRQYGKWPTDGTWLDAVPTTFQHFLDSLSNWACGWSLEDSWELTGIACCRKLNVRG